MVDKKAVESGLVVNKRDGAVDFKLFCLAKGESHKLTKEDKANELVMARIKRASEIGFIELT